ncbi:DsbA family protein [Flammeovirgaceae bacterium SG7u.111]|nr:DsbA family protein [Flammeovirgaceae bacterium SG7u.132]WPO35196.1 DsbA family protein [Flammeovirgaceae bacterium SG7u.111]
MADIEIMYVYDALCGWCYGFSPVIRQLSEKYGEQIKFTALSGGMVLRERVGPVGETAGYIKWAYKEVEDVSGVKFGNGFLTRILEEGSYMYSSEKPGVAMTAFKSLSDKGQVEFAGKLQKALFFNGENLNRDDVYGQLVEDFSIDKEEFLKRLRSEEYRTLTYEEFNKVGDFGINGFPSLILKQGEKLYSLSRGYQGFDALDEQLSTFLAEL